MKRRATALLGVTAVILVVAHVEGHGRGWLGYVQATAEASMVGGLADWFAVTALFRHPLGLPIPHTAIIRERKEQFGETLGSFVQQNFLTPAVVAERIRAAHLVERASAWAVQPDHAAQVSGHVADLVVSLTDAVGDDEVHQLLAEGLERGVEALPVTALAAQGLRLMTAQDRHQELLESILHGLERLLDDNAGDLRSRFGQQSPWWLPGAMEDRIFERLMDGVRRLLHEVNTDPEHELRKRFRERLDDLIDRLEHAPELQARAEELKRNLLAQPELRSWTITVWADVKDRLRGQAADPTSELRIRAAAAVTAAGRRLQDDPELAAKAERAAETLVQAVTERFHGELAELVSATVARWDAGETSDKLELLLGPDLQFIRINGTIVGGLAGLIIFTVLRLAG